MRTWRTVNVFKDKGLSGDSGKETFALPRTHMIGDMWLVLRNTNASGGNINDGVTYQGIEHCLTGLKIKSGSKTFRDLDGEMARLIAAHGDGRLAPAFKTMKTGVEQETVFHLPFGLEPQDEDVILPAPLLDSLDMIMEYTFPTTGSTVGFASGSAEFDLYMDVLEPTADLEDKMILVQEKKQDFTPATAGSVPFDLTLDERRLLRKVYVQAYKETVGTGAAEGGVIRNLKLKADNEEVVDTTWRALQFKNAMDSRLQYRDHILVEGTGDNGDVYLSRIPDVYASSAGVDAGCLGELSIINDGITTVTSGDADIHSLSMWSDVLPTVAVLDFDRDKSMRRLQPQGIRDLDLILEDVVSTNTEGAIYEESLQKIW